MKKGYVIKRILYSVFILFVVTTLNFFIPRIGVDDPAERYYPPQGNMSDAEYEVIKQLTREEYGFDVSTPEQYLNYLGDVAQGDFGTSFRSGNPAVTGLIADRLPWTLTLSATTLVLGLIGGILFGVFAATKRGRWQDTTLLNMSTIMTALPAFFIALILSFYLGFEFEIFPAYTNPNLVGDFSFSLDGLQMLARNAALPIISMSFGSIIGYAQTTRNAVIAVTNEDYIVTARAKGLPQRSIRYKHTLRNSLLPIVTSLGFSIGGLLGGQVVIEQIFNWHGMGTLFLEANEMNDYPLMMAIMLLLSAFTILAILVTDLVYVLLDPRVTVGEKR